MASTRVDTSHATLAGRMMNPPVAVAAAAQLAEVVLTWFDRARQRRQLRDLSDHMLKDVGLNRADVEVEVAKPFWRQ